MSFRNVSGIYEKNSFTLDAMILTLVCRPKLCAGKIGVLSFFVEKAVDVLRKVSMKSSIEIFILSKKEFKLFNCVLLGKRISRKY